MLWCKQCNFWGMCADCTSLPRLPALTDDPLLRGPRDPCLLELESQRDLSIGSSQGTMIVCTGGNYETLVANEANPVVEWLHSHGIRAYVLRYRLLPAFQLRDSIHDLHTAITCIRRVYQGPVGAIGFSAGGHLVASSMLKSHAAGEVVALDAQVLCYPGLDATEWQALETCGFFDIDDHAVECLKGAPALIANQHDLFGGSGFWAPPSLLVSSIWDVVCPPEKTTDRYAEALTQAGIPHKYLRDDFGRHGFALDGGWTDACIEWLASMGFGAKSVS
eukprot:gnl/TRDRNA2_/TRDRNA2_159904_c0_seq4.p1 gnl/TRDRNA2_/TRDRNA2_159904_c0~~gnl/TRDRNA2_/TRDRNA2_159904_c0_seq4.p1  ORF type:complete len:277 (-),score=19.74 gnl/TRDRNA2_/TRDRNA2_159904_c0_seq4:56-886(-)